MKTIDIINNTDCQYYKNVSYNKSFKTIKLIDWLGYYSEKNADMIEMIRETNKKDEKLAKKMKTDNLPAVTITATFPTYRRADLAGKINPVIAIDIDKQDNMHVGDWDKLKMDVFTIDGVFLSSYSCRGEGIFCLVYFDLSKDIEKLFEALRCTFKEKLNITIDKNCKDITRLRFISYDKDIKIKTETNMFSEEKEIQQRLEFNEDEGEFNWDEDFTFKAIYYLIKEQGYRSNEYSEWLLDGFRLATFGKRGWLLYYLLSKMSKGFDENAFNDKWNECTRKTKFTKNSLSYYFGLLKKELGSGWMKKIEEYEIKKNED